MGNPPVLTSSAPVPAPTQSRISFEEAIGEDLLFKRPFSKLSVPQQMILKAIYGLELNEEELVFWSAFSGMGEFDELGFLVGLHGRVPYVPQEYTDVTIIVGRRSGKSSGVSSPVVAYEALCGGHKAFVGARQDPVFLQVAQDLATARANLRQFILDWLAESPIGKKELEKFGSSAITADSIRLKRGLITVGPPTMKLRGQAIACCAMDELCVWPKDKEASNPDIEVQRAVEPALAQFYPFGKIVKTSTPMTEEGLLWEASQIGTRGGRLSDPASRHAHARTLVLSAPTAALDNPVFRRIAGGARVYLAEKRQKDPIAFEREYLARFSKSVGGFLSNDALRGAMTDAPPMRDARTSCQYVATIDPAFKHDDFALCIGHLEGGHFVQDYLHAWRGTKESPLRPGAVMDELEMIIRPYGIRMITSDQWHDVSLMELGQQRGLAVEPSPLTLQLKQQMWQEFNSLLLQGKIHLVDSPTLLDELMKMERVYTRFGNVKYAGAGRRDDLAMVTALCLHKALQMGEVIRMGAAPVEPVVSLVKKRIQARARLGREEGGNWWNE